MATLFSQGLSLLVLPWTVQNFSPTSFGENGLITLLSTLIASIITLNSEVMIYQKRNNDSVNDIICGNIKRSLFIFAINLTIVFLVFYIFNYKNIWILIFILAPIQAIYTNIYNYSNKFGKYKIMSIMVIINSFCTSILPNVIYTHETYSLVFGYLLGMVTCLLINYRLVYGSVFIKKSPLVTSGLYVFLQNSISIISQSALGTVLTLFYGSAFYGMYGMAIRILNAPMTFASSSISQVYAKEMSESRSLSLFKSTCFLSVTTSFLAYSIIVITFYFLDSLLPIEWTDVKPIIFIMAIAYLFWYPASCLSYTPIILNKLKYNFWISLLGLGLVQTVAISSGLFGITDTSMIKIMSLTQALYFLGCVFWYGKIVYEENNIKAFL